MERICTFYYFIITLNFHELCTRWIDNEVASLAVRCNQLAARDIDCSPLYKPQIVYRILSRVYQIRSACFIHSYDIWTRHFLFSDFVSQPIQKKRCQINFSSWAQRMHTYIETAVKKITGFYVISSICWFLLVFLYYLTIKLVMQPCKKEHKRRRHTASQRERGREWSGKGRARAWTEKNQSIPRKPY